VILVGHDGRLLWGEVRGDHYMFTADRSILGVAVIRGTSFYRLAYKTALAPGDTLEVRIDPSW
jgi:hypothetical protein